MIIPWTRIKWISDQKGYGLIATKAIPKGTVSFVQDELDIVIPTNHLTKINPHLSEFVEKYSYEDHLGNRVISWDFGKYMNHDDNANTLTTGYGFEVVVRDIHPGEEVTDDYRIFSTHHDTNFAMDRAQSKKLQLLPKSLLDQWDEHILSALKESGGVEQPLQAFIGKSIWQETLKLSQNPANYRSVREALPLKYKPRKKACN